MLTKKQSGFTLVELSIVLVIIGLILGGVLVGQDLIKAAQVRAQVSQIQQLDAAINTFRAKYGGLPGDFLKATTFGLCTTCSNGDGDSVIDDNAQTSVSFNGEVASMWMMLSKANLIAGTYTDVATAAAAFAPVIGTNIPETKLGKGGLLAANLATVNYWAISMASNSALTFGAGFTPAEAFGVDAKIDDGKPTTGLALARNTAAAFGAALATAAVPVTNTTIGAAGACTVTVAAVTDYNVSNEQNICPLIVRISG